MRVILVTEALYEYIEKQQCHDRLIFRGRWRQAPGKVVADALVSGIWPVQLKQQIQADVAMSLNASHDPMYVLDIMRHRAERWKEVEIYQTYRRQSRYGYMMPIGP